MAPSQPGHVFVVKADITALRCDAWLCPTDASFHVTGGFGEAVGKAEGGFWQATALTVSPVEILKAEGYVLGAPANAGFINGALKLAFDQSYYQLLDSTRGRPFGVYLHGNEGTEGAKPALDGITARLGWVKGAETVVVLGKPTKADVEAHCNLAATVAATLMGE